jgi:hypothetical protein
MALAGGLFTRSHVARNSGAFGHFCVLGARFVGAIDDSIFLFRGAPRIPCMDDARVIVRFCNRLGSLLRIDSTAVDPLNTGYQPRLGVDQSRRQLIPIEICCRLDEDFRASFMCTKVFAVRTGGPVVIDSMVDDEALA